VPEKAGATTLEPGSVTTLTQTRPDTAFEDGDHERMSHIVLEGFRPRRGPFLPLGASVVESMVTGTPVRALCGKVWVPNRDPKRYPLCPTCREIAEARGWKVPAG
jgi:hypothetical protein